MFYFYVWDYWEVFNLSQGREKEAQAIYNTVLKTKPSDIALVAVASNNLMTINKDQVLKCNNVI